MVWSLARQNLVADTDGRGEQCQPRLSAIYFLVKSRESFFSWSHRNFQLGQASDSSFSPRGKVRAAVAPLAMTLALGRVPFGNGELRVGKGS